MADQSCVLLIEDENPEPVPDTESYSEPSPPVSSASRLEVTLTFKKDCQIVDFNMDSNSPCVIISDLIISDFLDVIKLSNYVPLFGLTVAADLGLIGTFQMSA